MITRIVLYGVLLACTLAMLLLLTGFAAWQLEAPWLSGKSYALAGSLMLLAFSCLLLLGGGLLLRTVYLGVADYFAGDARALRRVWMLHSHKRNAGQRMLLEKRQIHYWHQLKRQRMLTADDKKHSRALFKAINAELQESVAPERYKALRKHLKQHRKQVNPQAMLALRDQELCRF